VFIGNDQYNMQAALIDCAEKLENSGLTIKVVRLSHHFYGSGFSENSGFGYDRSRCERINLMAEDTSPDAID
jgi:hypothetical protein